MPLHEELCVPLHGVQSCIIPCLHKLLSLGSFVRSASSEEVKGFLQRALAGLYIHKFRKNVKASLTDLSKHLGLHFGLPELCLYVV